MSRVHEVPIYRVRGMRMMGLPHGFCEGDLELAMTRIGERLIVGPVGGIRWREMEEREEIQKDEQLDLFSR